MDHWLLDDAAVSATLARADVAETATGACLRTETRFSEPGIPLALTRSMINREWVRALEERTKRFAIEVVSIVRVARQQPELRAACDQLSASAGSVAANHRAMGRAASDKAFAAKLQTVSEESDESAHWLEQLKLTNRDAALQPSINRVLREAIELRNIFAKAKQTTRDRYFPEQKPTPKADFTAKRPPRLNPPE
jgi:four helix bundle protein